MPLHKPADNSSKTGRSWDSSFQQASTRQTVRYHCLAWSSPQCTKVIGSITFKVNSALQVLKCQHQKFQAPCLSAEEANPEAKHPCDPRPPGFKDTAFDLPKFTSQLSESPGYPTDTVTGRCRSCWERADAHKLGVKRNLTQIVSLSSETVLKPSRCSRSIHAAEILRLFNPMPETQKEPLTPNCTMASCLKK